MSRQLPDGAIRFAKIREPIMSKTHHLNGSLSDLSRRGVLQGATALGTAALLGPLGAGRAAAQPKPGGTLRLGIAHGSTTDRKSVV